MGRPRVPVGDRKYLNRWPRTIPVATNLSPDEVDELDRFAALASETRSEYIRRAVRERMSKP